MTKRNDPPATFGPQPVAGRRGWDVVAMRAAVAATLAALCAGLLTGAGCRAGITRGEILYSDALESLALGDSAAALDLLQSAAWEMPDNARVKYLLGELYARQGTIESRALAEKELRRATVLDPQGGVYHEALGEVLHRQGFHHDSMSSLRRAIQLDPTLAHAWFTLGLELEAEFVEEPTSSTLRDSTLFCFERALDADSTLADARYRYAYLLLARGQPERARPVARRGLAREPCAGRFGLLLTAIEYRAGRVDAASRFLDSTLACMRPVDRAKLLVPRDLMHPDSVFCFDCTPAERDSAVEAYWWALDPTPATLVNERVLEHVARVVDADFYFEVPGQRIAGRDTDRGEIYLRYGTPDMMWRDIDANVRSWRWGYAGVGGYSQEFLFLDVYLSGRYVRVRQRVDFVHKDLMELAPERTLFHLGPDAPEWRYAMRTFRGEAGRTAVEVAFGFDRIPAVDSVRVDLAAWRRPGERLAARTVAVAARDLYQLSGERCIGRVRFEVPSENLEVGLQAVATPADPQRRAARLSAWAATGRDSLWLTEDDPHDLAMSDLLPAHELRAGRGGMFDLGGVIAVPRVDMEITGGRLHLYFEVYPGHAILASRHTLEVTYRVQALPPQKWRFRDQFSAAGREKYRSRTAVESTFEIRPRRTVERQQLSIDLRNLAPGDYRLTVVVAPIGGHGEVSRELEFSIAEPRGASRP